MSFLPPTINIHAVPYRYGASVGIQEATCEDIINHLIVSDYTSCNSLPAPYRTRGVLYQPQVGCSYTAVLCPNGNVRLQAPQTYVAGAGDLRTLLRALHGVQFLLEDMRKHLTSTYTMGACINMYSRMLVRAVSGFKGLYARSISYGTPLPSQVTGYIGRADSSPSVLSGEPTYQLEDIILAFTLRFFYGVQPLSDTEATVAGLFDLWTILLGESTKEFLTGSTRAAQTTALLMLVDFLEVGEDSPLTPVTRTGWDSNGHGELL